MDPTTPTKALDAHIPKYYGEELPTDNDTVTNPVEFDTRKVYIDSHSGANTNMQNKQTQLHTTT